MRRRPVVVGGVVGAVGLLGGLAVAVWPDPGAVESGAYELGEPRDVLDAAQAMVENGEARRLPELVYAENEHIRAVLERMGALLGDLQELSAVIQERFPEDVARVREQVAAGEGSLFASVGRGGPGAGLGPLLADPYMFLREARGRLDAVQIADDVAAITVDGRPALGVGLTMRLENGRWQVVPPLNAPGAGRFLPRTAEEWSIVGSMMQALANALYDLRRDLEADRCRNLEDAAQLAGQKAVAPMVMIFAAYRQAMEAREGAGSG